MISSFANIRDKVECAVICDLGVSPDLQGTGIEKRMLGTLKEQVRCHLRIICMLIQGKRIFIANLSFPRWKPPC